MSLNERVPPSRRDFQVFELITVEQKTTREAAEAARVSQTRVCQIVQRVGEFMVSVVPVGEEADTERRIRLAEQIAAARVQFLLKLAVRSFEQSQGEQRTERQAVSGTEPRKTVTLRSTQGDPRYLAAAGRLAMLGAKLPASNLGALIGDVVEDEDDCEEEVSEPAAPQHPRDGDCSEISPEQPQTAETPAEAECATPAPDTTCELNPSQAWIDLRIAKPTVQATVHVPAKGEAAGVSEHRRGQPLSKSDRKARQRLLEQKRRGSSRAG